MSEQKKPTLPKFQVTKPKDVSKEEFEEYDKKSGGGNFLAEPGKYSFEVTGIDYLGPSASDKSWHKILVELTTVSKKSIRDMVMVPTDRIQFKSKKGKNTGFVYSKWKGFLVALGVKEVSQENVCTFAGPLFNDKKIIGMKMEADVGYTEAHAKYLRQEGENPCYALVFGDGKVYNDAETGEPVVFMSRDAVQAAAVEMGITDFQPFMEILSWGECPVKDQMQVIENPVKKSSF